MLAELMLTKELPNHRLDWVRAEAASTSISITEDDDGGQQKQSALASESVRTEKSELYQPVRLSAGTQRSWMVLLGC